MMGQCRLSDAQWAPITPHPRYRGAGGRREDDRRVVSGIGPVLRSGRRWRDCPAEYGSDTTVYNRYHRRSRKGIRRYPFAALTASLAGTPEEISVDSTDVKARRCAGGGKGGHLSLWHSSPVSRNSVCRAGCSHGCAACRAQSHFRQYKQWSFPLDAAP